MTRDDTPALARIERVASSVAAAVAPVGVLTALLFYFGYASTRAQYAYFGVDIDTVGLSTQDYVMRSPEPLLTPLMVLLVLAATVAGLNSVVRRRIEGARSGQAVAVRERRRRYRRRASTLARLGGVALGAGLLLLFAYPVLQAWPPYPLATPLLLAAGAAVLGYGRRLVGLLDRRPRPRGTVLTFLVVAFSVFWATATIAQWSGTGAGARGRPESRPPAGPHPRHEGAPVPDVPRCRCRGDDAAARREPGVPLPLPRAPAADPGPGPAVPRPHEVVGEQLDPHDPRGRRLGADPVPVPQPASQVSYPRREPYRNPGPRRVAASSSSACGR